MILLTFNFSDYPNITKSIKDIETSVGNLANTFKSAQGNLAINATNTKNLLDLTKKLNLAIDQQTKLLKDGNKIQNVNITINEKLEKAVKKTTEAVSKSGFKVNEFGQEVNEAGQVVTDFNKRTAILSRTISILNKEGKRFELGARS